MILVERIGKTLLGLKWQAVNQIQIERAKSQAVRLLHQGFR